MITIRRSAERGHVEHGWLDTRHTFSFASYFDRNHMGFRSLRVINEDVVAAGKGFGMHPHNDMEIITYVLEGALAHRDSMGTSSVIRPGEVQRMSAGTGVMHSEVNPSDTEPVHLLQIWILPEREGIEPSYEQKEFSDEEKRATLRLVASPDGADGSVTIHQDARLYAALLEPGETVEHAVAAGRHAWIQVVRGTVTVDGERLEAGDGASTSEAGTLVLAGEAPAEILLFDLS